MAGILKIFTKKITNTVQSKVLVEHPGRLLMRGIFDAYVLRPFDKKIFFELVTGVNMCDIINSCIYIRSDTMKPKFDDTRLSS